MAQIPGRALRLGDLPKPPAEPKPKKAFVRKVLMLPTDLWEATCFRALEEDVRPDQLMALALAAFLRTEPEPTPTSEGSAPKGGRS